MVTVLPCGICTAEKSRRTLISSYAIQFTPLWTARIHVEDAAVNSSGAGRRVSATHRIKSVRSQRSERRALGLRRTAERHVVAADGHIASGAFVVRQLP